MTGTLINTATVLAGTGAGLLVGARLPDRVHETVFKGLGLLTLLLGVQMGLETRNVLIPMGSLLAGAVVGELLRLQERLDALGDRLQARFGGRGRFSEAFVTSSLVFCVGPMTVLGSIRDGLSGDYELLAVKSLMDGFAALAFATTLGPGVAFSALTVLVLQGGLTVSAGALEHVLNEVMVAEISACGGLMLLGIALTLLDVARPRVANFLPSLVLAPLIVWVTHI